VLYDDTAERPGAKFASMDLIGIPVQLIVGPRGLEKGQVEIKHRATGAREELSLAEAINRFTK
jgi:prolyl-tRNA synthetase